MIVYIVGPMTGYEEFNRPAFNNAAAELVSKGFTVLNPAVLPDGLTDAQYMQIDTSMLFVADAIYLLNGWQESQGAQAEYSLAVKLEKRILFEPFLYGKPE